MHLIYGEKKPMYYFAWATLIITINDSIITALHNNAVLEPDDDIDIVPEVETPGK